MLNYFKSAAAAAGLGLLLAACGGNGNVTLTPPPVKTTYYQIELLSRPAIKEVFEPFVDHQKTNVVEPYNDPTILADITATANALRPPNATAGTNYGKVLASVLYPDTYTVNLNGTVGGFLGVETGLANFGGRLITDDVVDTELGILFGKTLQALKLQAEDGEENGCLETQNLTSAAGTTPTATFPYLQTAH